MLRRSILEILAPIRVFSREDIKLSGIMLLIGIPLLIGVAASFWWLNSRTDKQRINLTIVDGQLQSPTSTISVMQGQTVSFVITSNQDEQVHIEGYHAFTAVAPNKPTLLEVQALTPGQFPIHLEKAKKVIATLDVKPFVQ